MRVGAVLTGQTYASEIKLTLQTAWRCWSHLCGSYDHRLCDDEHLHGRARVLLPLCCVSGEGRSAQPHSLHAVLWGKTVACPGLTWSALIGSLPMECCVQGIEKTFPLTGAINQQKK